MLVHLRERKEGKKVEEEGIGKNGVQEQVDIAMITPLNEFQGIGFSIVQYSDYKGSRTDDHYGHDGQGTVLGSCSHRFKVCVCVCVCARIISWLPTLMGSSAGCIDGYANVYIHIQY